MRSLILRSFSITAIALLFIQDAGAQRGRGYYRHYGYGPYRGQRVVHIGGPRVVIPYSVINAGCYSMWGNITTKKPSTGVESH